jgi:hypothetical protein
VRAPSLVVAVALAAGGCASAGSQPGLAIEVGRAMPAASFDVAASRAAIDPANVAGAVVKRTSFEGPEPDATVRGGGSSRRDSKALGTTDTKPNPVKGDPGNDQQQRLRRGFFWAGIALTAIGGATFVASAVGGRITQAQLQKGYDRETITHDQEKTYHTRGDVFNALTATGATLLIVGVGTASISFGIDYSRCGSLAKRKRKDCRN